MTTVTKLDRLEQQLDELIAVGNAARDLGDLQKYRGTPGDIESELRGALAFMKEELGFKPYDKQVEIIRSFIENPQTAVRGFHGAGKDAVLAPLMLYAAYVRGMLVIAISATEKQLLDQLWREVRRRFSSRLPGQLYTADLRIKDEKRIIATTSRNISNLTGYHDPGGVFVAISESQAEQVEAAAFDAALANTIDDKSRVAVVGNPVKPEGRYYEIHQKSTWHKIKISAFDHPNIREGREVIPGGPSQKWIDLVREEHGTDSNWWVSRVLAEFPSDKVDGLIKREWLEDAYARHESGELNDRTLFGRPIVSLDVSRMGRDKCVAAIVCAPVLREFVVWKGVDHEDTAKRAVQIAKDFWHSMGQFRGREARQPTLVIDGDGLGSGVVDQPVCKRWPTIEYRGSHKPKAFRNPPKFTNRRAESHWRLRELLQNGEIALPRDAQLTEELLAVEWEEKDNGAIQIISKDLIIKALGRSPDKGDATVMAFVEAMPPKGTGTWIGKVRY